MNLYELGLDLYLVGLYYHLIDIQISHHRGFLMIDKLLHMIHYLYVPGFLLNLYIEIFHLTFLRLKHRQSYIQ